jgi:hypothetical protein
MAPPAFPFRQSLRVPIARYDLARIVLQVAAAALFWYLAWTAELMWLGVLIALLFTAWAAFRVWIYTVRWQITGYPNRVRVSAPPRFRTLEAGDIERVSVGDPARASEYRRGHMLTRAIPGLLRRYDANRPSTQPYGSPFSGRHRHVEGVGRSEPLRTVHVNWYRSTLLPTSEASGLWTFVAVHRRWLPEALIPSPEPHALAAAIRQAMAAATDTR